MPLLYSEEMKAYRRLLSEDLARTFTHRSKFAKYMGFIDTSIYENIAIYGSTRGLQPTGKPIEVLQNFLRGGLSMDIPVMYPLVNQPKTGADTLLGSEEARRLFYKTVSISQYRHGVVQQDNKLSKQALENPNMIKQLLMGNQTELKDYFGRLLSYQPYLALYTGYSDNLVLSAGKTQKSHPNFFVPKLGRVGWDSVTNTYVAGSAPGTAGYEAAVLAGVNGMDDGCVFNTKIIDNMVLNAGLLRIPKTAIGEYEGYLIHIHPGQAAQLRADTRWITGHKDVMLPDENKKLFSGQVEGWWNGAYIIVDECNPGVSTSTGALVYGNSNYMANPIFHGDIKLAVLIGASAIACGYGDKLSFETEDKDYKQWIGDAASMMVGFERGDIVDADGNVSGNTLGTSAFLENTSSLVVATKSPVPSDWNPAEVV